MLSFLAEVPLLEVVDDRDVKDLVPVLKSVLFGHPLTDINLANDNIRS